MNEMEIKRYGMTVAEIRDQYMNSLTAKFSGLEMVVMGILSDVQELNDQDVYKGVRQKQLNVAKFILSEMLEAKRVA